MLHAASVKKIVAKDEQIAELTEKLRRAELDATRAKSVAESAKRDKEDCMALLVKLSGLCSHLHKVVNPDGGAEEDGASPPALL